MPKRFNKGFVRLHEFVIASGVPWLVGSYAKIRELAVYALHVPARLFIDSSRLENNFLIYAQPRTGSTVLVDLLNSSPFVRCDREIFMLRTTWTEAFMDAKRSLYPDKAYGCKIMGYQLERQVRQPGMKPFLQKMYHRGWKIIHLKRRNILRQALSQILVQQSGRLYQLASDPSLAVPLNVDLAKLQGAIQSIEKATARDETLLEGIPHLKLIYEEDLLKPETHQSTLDRVFAYLELPMCQVRTQLKRITPVKIPSLVENFEELKTFAIKSHYADFLDQP